MKLRYEEREEEGLRFSCMDVTELQLEDSSVDVVLEKCVMDCFACSTSSDGGNLIISQMLTLTLTLIVGSLIISQMLTEAARVLKPGGVYICVSLHRAPVVLSRIRESNNNGKPLWREPIEVVIDTVGETPGKGRREKVKEDSSDDTESEDDEEGQPVPGAGLIGDGNGDGFAILRLRCAKLAKGA